MIWQMSLKKHLLILELSNYETYLQWRIDTGIADILNPLLVGGWDGVVSSIKRLGIPKGI